MNGLVILGILWGLVILIIVAILEPTPESLTIIVSIFASGFYTLFLYFTRFLWLRWLARRPLLSAALLGIFNAAVVETVFWFFEKVFGAEGVAAHPNLIVDLAITMPWYILMVISFVRVQARWRFSAAVVLLLGAVYETGGDGIVGGLVVPLLLGEGPAFFEFWVMMALVAFWQFIPVYSSMVLPPAWIVADDISVSPTASPIWLDALKPLFWLIPFTFYILAILLILSFV